MNIYFLRHGETEENSKRMYYGKRDISLNEKGRRQCISSGKVLENICFNKVFISERRRTRESADIVFNHSRNDFITDKRINERSFGIFEGMTYDEIEEKYPMEWENWGNDWENFMPPGGENYSEFFKRVQLFMKDIEAENCDNILVVTHGGVIRAAYCVILEEMKLYWKFASRNADISILKYEYGNWYIDSIIHAGEV